VPNAPGKAAAHAARWELRDNARLAHTGVVRTAFFAVRRKFRGTTERLGYDETIE
jgi:hypothetical protein